MVSEMLDRGGQTLFGFGVVAYGQVEGISELREMRFRYRGRPEGLAKQKKA